MNQASEQKSNPMSYAWLGLLVGFGVIALMVWQNTGAGVPNRSRDWDPSKPNDHSGIIVLTKGNWQKVLAESKIPVLVDFWAPWCGPCRKLGPTIDKLAVDYSGRLQVCKVNVDDNEDMAEAFGIKAIPTVLFFRNGKRIADPVQGAASEAQLTRIIDRVLQMK